MAKPLVICVLGMMGRCPFGGQTWLYLNWLSGLHSLGHQVWYVEDDTVWPYDPEQNTVTDDCSYAVRHLAGCMERIGLSGQWAFRLADREGACWGLSPAKLDAASPGDGSRATALLGLELGHPIFRSRG